MPLSTKDSIFDSPSQMLQKLDPATIRLQADRLLIREIPEPKDRFVGSILIPENVEVGAGKGGCYRYGEVLAVGPGNSCVERGLDTHGDVRRVQITQGCDICEGRGKFFDSREYCTVPCPRCDGSGRIPLTVPCSCKVGDKVVFDLRREAQFFVNGEKLHLLYEEQAVVGILEGM